MWKTQRVTTESREKAQECRLALEDYPRSRILDQEAFLKMLTIEQKRTERSRRRFVLMLLESSGLLHNRADGAFDQVLEALAHSVREIDIVGWYEELEVLGVIFTEIGTADGKSVVRALLTRVNNALSSVLRIEEINQIRLSFHVFPEDWDQPGDGPLSGPILHKKSESIAGPTKASLIVKRSMDIVGSLLALALLAPLFAVVAVAVRLSSKGPILFRQQRVGQYGKKFTFIKFRSMYCANNDAVHKEYMKGFISGNAEADQRNGNGPAVYKLKNDPRLTPVGGFLRKSSLDELPQFVNVLKGEMSLVGPRPPIPYELNCYDIWHRRRLSVVKPGITGLWQVTGRSKVKFDDMVRLDLKYAKAWSIWLDVKILLQTPRAVLTREGAF
jgi:lipopolysaccharide/colanic/teichoic acid biosynthesis glycosyltransferase